MKEKVLTLLSESEMYLGGLFHLTDTYMIDVIDPDDVIYVMMQKSVHGIHRKGIVVGIHLSVA